MPSRYAEETISFDSAPWAPASDDPAAQDELVGTLLGSYRVVSVLGSGTMGRVYQAEHSGLKRISALKVLSPELTQRQPRMLERFQAEARAVATLAHPNIVTVYNLGQDRGYHFIDMELVPGGTSLKEELVRDGAFEPAMAVELVRQVTHALETAHAAGLIHRDVKPSNVLLTPEDRVKLADFGLVRRLGGSSDAQSDVAGTPTFMAPELFRGVPANPSTDLYALGVMLYYLLTARLPYVADRIDRIVAQHRKAPIPDPRHCAAEVPEELALLVMRLLAKNPSDRPPSAAVLREEFERILEHLQDTESLVQVAVEGLGGVVQGSRDHFQVVLPVEPGRLQEIYIESQRVRHGERTLAVFTVCGPAEPRHYEFALRMNAQWPQGGLAIREINGTPMFVIARTLRQSRTTPDELRAVVRELAQRGDWMEKRVLRDDLF